MNVSDRIVIENLRPRTPNGHPAKATVGRPLRISADVFREGHDITAARVRWRSLANGSKRASTGTGLGPRDAAMRRQPKSHEHGKWQPVLMEAMGNDRFEATIVPGALGLCEFVVEGWTDRVATWRHDVTVKHEAGQPVELEIEEGARLLEEFASRVDRAERGRVQTAIEMLRDASLPVEARLAPALEPVLVTLLAEIPDSTDKAQSRPAQFRVDRERAAVGAWYELFPRSYATADKNGFQGAADRLPAVAAMGFDIVYLPPVHPIGTSFRKGKNNTLTPEPDDPGSPWAIGNIDGGHTALHPELGTFTDFDNLVERARSLGMEIALDYALQCSPEHPWLKEHPEWFHHRPDGTIKYAENPPKKYQDIYPINMWPADDAVRMELWNACKAVLDFWIGHGIRIFRVDNPHTKPFAFWEWVIGEVQAEHPDTVFLAEAFTRPKLMARLAEVGFSQSYTYFTWRNTKAEFIEYLTEVALGPKADYMRPNFWPNTPDILSGILRRGGPGAFKLRLVLAATMSPSYGIYSGYELMENEPASETNEEYLNSEKYEIKHRDFERGDSLAPFIARINQTRRAHPALLELSNIRFHHTNNEWMLAWSKQSTTTDDVVLVVVNLDPQHVHDDVLGLDLPALGFDWDETYEAHDELTDVTYVWQGAHPYVRLSREQPAHVLHLRHVS